jgi:hypothetical protein
MLGGERSGELGGCGRIGIGCFAKKCLTTLCEWAHYHDGGASFPQSAFQVISLHPAHISELPDKNFDELSDLQE